MDGSVGRLPAGNHVLSSLPLLPFPPAFFLQRQIRTPMLALRVRVTGRVSL